MIYRIWIEDCKQRDVVIQVCQKYTPAFSILEGVGCWEGQIEDTLCVEIDSNGDITNTIKHLARELCSRFQQECVLVQCINATSWLQTS